jgi:hypothetical protein
LLELLELVFELVLLDVLLLVFELVLLELLELVFELALLDVLLLVFELVLLELFEARTTGALSAVAASPAGAGSWSRATNDQEPCVARVWTSAAWWACAAPPRSSAVSAPTPARSFFSIGSSFTRVARPPP